MNADPRFAKNIERFTQFLTLVGLTALLVGGVGVANAVRGFVDRKRASMATLKSLGAPGGQVVALYMTQVMRDRCLGIAIGLVIGAALPFIVRPCSASAADSDRADARLGELGVALLLRVADGACLRAGAARSSP